LIEASDCVVYLLFENVPVDKIDLIEDKLNEILSTATLLDMTRMETVVKRRIQQALAYMEDDPHGAVVNFAIGDIIYGKSDKDVSNS
jgi:hypothetical protein